MSLSGYQVLGGSELVALPEVICWYSNWRFDLTREPMAST